MIEKLVIGTRNSKLALRQADYVAGKIRGRYPEAEVVLKHIITTGDKIQHMPLAKIGGKGLFTKEIEKELLGEKIDLAVHSLKDLPAELPEVFTLGAIPRREDPGDALISPRYKTIDRLPEAARVGTSSLRRKAQLLNYRPDLVITDLRGNLDTRLAKLVSLELDAIVLAVAGLKRLGWENKITQVLPHDICLPAAGQGALALEIRSDDLKLKTDLEFLHHMETAASVTAERAFLSRMGGGCQLPVGVYGRVDKDRLMLEAVLLSVGGEEKLGDSISGHPAEAESLGRELALRMLEAGGGRILAALAAGSHGKE